MKHNDVVYGLFDDTATANRAVADLGREGYTYDEISVLTAADAPDATWSADWAGLETNGRRINGPAATGRERNDRAEDTAEGVLGGATLGGVAGALAGVAALAVPGFGPLFVAGPIASILTSMAAGATAGGAAGGLAGALRENGLPEPEAAFYEDGLRNGGVMVAVHTDREDQARRVMDAAGAVATREEAAR